MYVDPTGKFFITALLVTVGTGMLFGGAIAGIKAYKNGDRGLELTGSIVGGAIMGGAMGAITAIGGAVALGTIALSMPVAFGMSLGIGANT